MNNSPSRAMLGRDLRLFIREVPAALLIALLLGIFCALSAGALSHGSDSTFSRVKVALVDEEGSFVSGMALSMITGNPLLSNMELTKVSGKEAEEGVADGTYMAAIFLPDGFSGDYSVGKETQARIVISDQAPMEAEVLRLIASFGEDLLSTGQYGVFAGENLVIKYAPDRHSSYLARSNALFVGKVITDPKIRMETLSYGQTGVDPLNWYVLLYVMTFFFLLILGCFFVTRDQSTSMLRRLFISGVRMGTYLGSKILWSGLFYLLVAAVMVILGTTQGIIHLPAPSGQGALLGLVEMVVSLAVSLTSLLLTGMAILITLPEAPAVTTVTLVSLVGLFASGGILPRLELPGFVPLLGDLLPIGSSARCTSILLGGSFQPLYLLLCMAWGAGAYLLMRRHLQQVLKGDAARGKEKSSSVGNIQDSRSNQDPKANLMHPIRGVGDSSPSCPSIDFSRSAHAPSKPVSGFRLISFSLALKRFLRPSSIVLLIVVFATVMLGQLAGHHAALRPCGLFVEDQPVTEEEKACTDEVRDYLVEKGFVLYDSRSAMESDVSNGKLDCGAILLQGLGQGVSQASYEETTALLLSPDSFLTQIYQAHLTAALFKASSPALVYQSALESKVELDMKEIREELKVLWEGGHRFSFSLTTTAGQAPLEKDYGQDIALAAAALLLFAAILTGTRRSVASADSLWARVGRQNAIGKILFPALLCTAVFYMLSAMGVPGEVRLALPAYVLAITALGLMLARLPLQIRPLVPIVLLGSLAMLPVYFDFASMVPALSFLHYVLPPCWLLKMKEAPMVSFGVTFIITSLLVLFYPQKKR